eukprot:CAMPEP_0202921034 /NCGR_PEP_ID=MMETSP1392-20130828/77178_1 /ASSEMBLY_ACC=CAM_ASM_000868 /TAXON_ID=225041 /ORGANISM="Chlamydomonas chlamydogama, Strain SAG 11-48b" /LENGTH=89 /DNA_ID=CAMNT_0049614571 /DNA_START=817 /DNA_END=1086 /DNA_ORIENTATION=+
MAPHVAHAMPSCSSWLPMGWWQVAQGLGEECHSLSPRYTWPHMNTSRAAYLIWCMLRERWAQLEQDTFLDLGRSKPNTCLASRARPNLW